MIQKFRFSGDGRAVAEDLRTKFGFEGDLARIYAGNTGPVAHKWHHYLPIYDRYFAARRGTPVRFLEIGVSKGGSLKMWREYLGPEAVIFGIDIEPACADLNGHHAQVRIGSQADPDFLAGVVDEMGGIDVVLDDGSHQMDHVHETLRILFPRLVSGGTYMIEDLHTAYARSFGGGFSRDMNFFNEIRRMVDDMHHW